MDFLWRWGDANKDIQPSTSINFTSLSIHGQVTDMSSFAVTKTAHQACASFEPITVSGESVGGTGRLWRPRITSPEPNAMDYGLIISRRK